MRREGIIVVVDLRFHTSLKMDMVSFCEAVYFGLSKFRYINGGKDCHERKNTSFAGTLGIRISEHSARNAITGRMRRYIW